MAEAAGMRAWGRFADRFFRRFCGSSRRSWGVVGHQGGTGRSSSTVFFSCLASPGALAAHHFLKCGLSSLLVVQALRAHDQLGCVHARCLRLAHFFSFVVLMLPMLMLEC